MGAGHFAANGKGLPSLWHGKQALVLSLVVNSTSLNPLQPLASIDFFANHVVIES